MFPEREFSVSPSKIACSRGKGEIIIEKEMFSGLVDKMSVVPGPPNGTYLPHFLSVDEIERLLLACRKFVGWP